MIRPCFHLEVQHDLDESWDFIAARTVPTLPISIRLLPYFLAANRTRRHQLFNRKIDNSLLKMYLWTQ